MTLPSWIGTAFFVAGIAVAGAVARGAARRRGLPVRRTIDGLFVMLLVGVLASHALGALLYRWPDVLADPWLALPGSDNASTLGAVLGALAAGLLWFRGEPADVRRTHADVLAVALAFGWGVGRLGCALRHDHLGALTSSPLGVEVAGGARHDLGFYEAVLAFALGGALVRLGRRRPPAGTQVGIAAIVFGAGRLAIEHLRADDLERLGRRSDPRVLGFTAVQLAAPILIAAGVVLVARIARITRVAQPTVKDDAGSPRRSRR